MLSDINTQYYNTNSLNNLRNGNINADLSIFHLNAQSLAGKFDEINVQLKQIKNKFDIICFTESWLNTNIKDIYNLDGYKAYHCLRELGNRGGGISVYVHERIKAEVIYTTSLPHIEALFLKITTGRKHTIIGTLYRPPICNSDDFTNSLLSILNNLQVMKSNTETILTGDFNLDVLKSDNHIGMSISLTHYLQCI